jgi:hypothetical protein
MSVEPRMILGDPTINIAPDTLRVSYSKFNIHEHTPATVDSFFYTPINIGDIINIYQLGKLITQVNSTVKALSSNQLELSKITTNQISDSNCLIEIPSKNIIINNVEVSPTTDTILLMKTSGFINPNDYKNFKHYKQNYVLTNYVLNENIILLPPTLIEFYRLSRFIVNCSSNSISNVILEIYDIEDTVIEQIDLTLVDQKQEYIVSTYTEIENHSYSECGIRVKVLGTSEALLSIALDLITP